MCASSRSSVPGTAYAERAVPSRTNPGRLRDAAGGGVVHRVLELDAHQTARLERPSGHRVDHLPSDATASCRRQDAVADLGETVIVVDGEEADVPQHLPGLRVDGVEGGVGAVRPVRTVAAPGRRGLEVGALAARVPQLDVRVVEQLVGLRRVLLCRRAQHQVGRLQTFHGATLGRSGADGAGHPRGAGSSRTLG